MTIDEAIMELENHLKDSRYQFRQTHEQAIQLGIEALKRLKKEREEIGRWHARILPGETEE